MGRPWVCGEAGGGTWGSRALDVLWPRVERFAARSETLLPQDPRPSRAPPRSPPPHGPGRRGEVQRWPRQHVGPPLALGVRGAFCSARVFVSVHRRPGPPARFSPAEKAVVSRRRPTPLFMTPSMTARREGLGRCEL